MVLTDSDFILLGLSIAGSIFAGIISSFLVQRKIRKTDTDEIVTNVKNVIKEELQVDLEHLQKEDLTTIKINSGTQTITSIMEVSSFESAVKSGNYILLNKDLRKDISEVYALMELANQHSYLLTKLTFVIKTTDLEVANYDRIFKWQKENLKEKHLELLPKIESLIKKLTS